MRIVLLALCIVLVVLFACSDDPAKPEPTGVEFRVAVAFPNLTFVQPADLRAANDGTNRLFVVEEDGVIHVFENTPDVATTEIFLDIRSRVESIDIEEGLLSLALDPDFASNGHFYVYYTFSNPYDGSRLSRFTVTPPGGNAADLASEEIILETTQPGQGHNGGQLAFDDQGLLYLGFGDGRSPGDPFNNAQDQRNILGSVIRIDVRTLPYTIPDDNPYKGNTMGYREEIFAHGFRNPWRLSIDPLTGDIWVGDVGQARYEEIDLVRKGGNYGWDCREGFHEYDLEPDPGIPSPVCASIDSFENPILEYPRATGRTVIGGVVYRGTRLSELVGHYLFADYNGQQLWSMQYDGMAPMITTLIDSTGYSFSSFGVDQEEVYLLHHDWDKAPTRIFKLLQVPVYDG